MPFHIELRAGKALGRAFNLPESELVERFIGPLLAGRTIFHSDHEWFPEETEVTVIEGPELGIGEIGLGRGWHNAGKTGTDVTQEILTRYRGRGGAAATAAAAATAGSRPQGLDLLKERLKGHLGAAAIDLDRIVPLAIDVAPGQRVSESVALAEVAVWELLHESAARLETALDETIVPPEEWQSTLLRWESWAESPSALRLAPPARG
jgi:hypothetical protein